MQVGEDRAAAPQRLDGLGDPGLGVIHRLIVAPRGKNPRQRRTTATRQTINICASACRTSFNSATESWICGA